MKFLKKPIIIEAKIFTEENKDQVYSWATEIQMNVYHSWQDEKPCLKIPTPEGEMTCSLGDYLLKEPIPTDWRKLYPCKPDIFKNTYLELTNDISEKAKDYADRFVTTSEDDWSDKDQQEWEKHYNFYVYNSFELI